ncbi:MAG TPA: hydrogenase maturation protease [Chloroflexota bacterium]|nr:hydrogenase maturation protease [Chloroflexota bacterium]
MTPRILVAGIGNIFLGDDGFGVEVVRRLAGYPLPDGVQVVDFGIRGLDLAYALLDDFHAVILVDAAARGEPPGTLYLIEPDVDPQAEVTLDSHGMDPVKVLALARALGARPAHTVVVACEPAVLGNGDDEDMLMGLSDRVEAMVDEAVTLVQSLVAEIAGVKVPT